MQALPLDCSRHRGCGSPRRRGICDLAGLAGDTVVITPEYIRSILDYDPSTGQFRWLRRDDVRSTWNTRYAGQSAYSLSHGYVRIGVYGRGYKAHRLAWAHFYGEWPTGHIDHINCDKQDNRISNLRIATPTQNNANCSARRGSICKGVTLHKKTGKFQAQVKANGKNHYLGLFETPDQASSAYSEAATILFGDFARPA